MMQKMLWYFRKQLIWKKQKKTQRERRDAEAPVFSPPLKGANPFSCGGRRCATGLPASRFIQCPNTLIRQYRCALGIAFYYVYTNTTWRHIRAERNGETICAERWSKNRTEVWYMVNGKKAERQPLIGERNDAAGLRMRPADTET